MDSNDIAGVLICVALPVAIVLIVAIRKILISRQQTAVLLKAIETNNNVDVDRLSDMMKRPKRSPKQLLQLRLLRGSIFSLLGLIFCISGLCKIIRYDSEAFQLIFGACLMAVGISYLIVYFMTRKDVEKECAEERNFRATALRQETQSAMPEETVEEVVVVTESAE